MCATTSNVVRVSKVLPRCDARDGRRRRDTGPSIGATFGSFDDDEVEDDESSEEDDKKQLLLLVAGSSAIASLLLIVLLLRRQ